MAILRNPTGAGSTQSIVALVQGRLSTSQTPERSGVVDRDTGNHPGRGDEPSCEHSRPLVPDVTSPRHYSGMLAIGGSTASIPCVTGQPCAACGDQTEVQGFPGLSSVVNYYLCKKCGHIWAVYKTDPAIIDHFWPVQKPNVNM